MPAFAMPSDQPALPEQRSLWEATATPSLPFDSLEGGLAADVVVVGAGFTGLSTALHLAERGRAVVVLEASSVGAGASGRNGGQVLFGGHQSLAELVRHFGELPARRLYDFGNAAAPATFALIARLGLHCDALQAGSIYAADSAAGLAETQAKQRALVALGVEARPLDREQVMHATGSAAYLGGYFNPLAGSVQPLSLVRELARAAQAAGARIHTRSPAIAIRRQGSGWRAHTPQGHVDARRVLLATNGRAGAAWPILERSVLPVWSFQVATDPLPASAGVLPEGMTVSDTRRLVRYFRRDREGRLVMGGKGTARAPRGPASFTLQRETLAHLYPQLAEQPLRWWWGGQVSVTLLRLPRLHVLDDGLLASVACNGKGVAWNTAIGPVLADALDGAPLDTLALPPTRPVHAIPLHGMQQAIAATGAAWLRLRDRLDLARSASTSQ